MAGVDWRSGELVISLEGRGRGEGLREVVFTTSRGGFTAAREAFIAADGLEVFISELEHMSATLTGQAELFGVGGEFTLRLAMAPGGHVKVYVEVNQTFAGLRIADDTDQTYLPSLRDGLLSLL